MLRRRLFVTVVTVPVLCTLPWHCLEEEEYSLTKVTYNYYVYVKVEKKGSEIVEKKGPERSGGY